MSLLQELLAYDPRDYEKRYRVYSAVTSFPRNLGEIADTAKVTTGDALNHVSQLEIDGLVICHSERHMEWRLAK